MALFSATGRRGNCGRGRSGTVPHVCNWRKLHRARRDDMQIGKDLYHAGSACCRVPAGERVAWHHSTVLGIPFCNDGTRGEKGMLRVKCAHVSVVCDTLQQPVIFSLLVACSSFAVLQCVKFTMNSCTTCSTPPRHPARFARISRRACMLTESPRRPYPHLRMPIGYKDSARSSMHQY